MDIHILLNIIYFLSFPAFLVFFILAMRKETSMLGVVWHSFFYTVIFLFIFLFIVFLMDLTSANRSTANTGFGWALYGILMFSPFVFGAPICLGGLIYAWSKKVRELQNPK